MKNQNKLKLLSLALGSDDAGNSQTMLDEILSDRKSLYGKEVPFPLKIYVAGPYTPYGASSHDAARMAHENTISAINVGVGVVEKGHFPYIPHLSHFMHLYGRKSLSYKYYTEADTAWLLGCDAILYYHHRIGVSKGADKELKIAIDTKKRIFFSLEELPLCRAWAEKYNS